MSRSGVLLLVWGLVAAGCGAGPAPGGSAPATEHAAVDAESGNTAPGWAAPFERSPAAQRCVDLADSQAFAEAIEACATALDEGPSPEVESALRDARSVLGEGTDPES